MAAAAAPQARFAPGELESARVLFARPAAFLMGAASLDDLPDADLPEVAFAGRSNVGKSSLINALVGRKHLARAAAAPGRTREVNFFLLDQRLRLVDLPGYGFAQAPRSQSRKFQNLARAYLAGRPNLKRVYLLVDSRHGLGPQDEAAMDALDAAAVSYAVVLTKTDKLKTHEASAKVEATLAAIGRRPAAFPTVIATSAEKAIGLAELRAEIAAAAETAP